MLGVRLICASLLAVASFSLTSANLNVNHICALVNNGLKIASYNACDTYYVCSGGVATMQTCAAGTYFDKENQMCLPQDQVHCWVASKVPCSGYSIGTWAPVDGSCSGYYFCSANGALLSTCPNGENFSPTLQRCVWADEYECSDISDIPDGPSNFGDSSSLPISFHINLCNFIPNGRYFGNPASCNGWNKCENNALITGVCPTGLLYNVLRMECDQPSDVTCSQVSNDPNLISRLCSVRGEIETSSDCSSYYVCDGTFYQLNKCPIGLYYDTVSKMCVNRLNARNNCNRCANVNNGFVNQYSAVNCTGYLYCKNGQVSSTGICPTGTYFNEQSGACLTINPLFGCCNPAFY